MDITVEDFEKEYVDRFSNEHMQYIIDFANTFQKTFPNIMDSETLVKRLSWIKYMEPTVFTDGAQGETLYSDYVVNYQEGLSEIDEKNVIYHELLHVISYHDEPNYGKSRLRGLYEDGSQFIGDEFYSESPIFDEMMNEFYTMKMLENEGIYKQEDYVIKRETQFDRSNETVRYHGNGYIKYVQLAELYDKLFGSDLLKAKLFNKVDFEKAFNERYKDVMIYIPNEEDTSLFAKIGMQISDKVHGSNLYGGFGTAIELWKINEQEKIDNRGFNLYEYLTDTNELMGYLPKREDKNAYRTDKSDTGIPEEVFSKITQMDEEFICKYLDPEIMSITDEYEKRRKINSLLTIVNVLRENIHDLSEEDLESITYGFIKENKQHGRDCMIVQAGNLEFMTFIDNSEEANYQFSAYSIFKKVEEYEDFKYGNKEEKELKDIFEQEGYIIDDYGYAIVIDNRFDKGRCTVVKSNGKYYKTEGGIEEVSLSEGGNIQLGAKVFNPEYLSSDMQELASTRTISGFNEMNQDIRTKFNEQIKSDVEEEKREEL